MGVLSKKSMLVALLILSLAACVSTRSIPSTLTVDLPCNGLVPSHDVAKTITFQSSACDLQEVEFIPDPQGNSTHLRKHPPGGKTVVFDYTDSSPPRGDGAYFYYVTKSSKSPNPDGGGGGIIK